MLSESQISAVRQYLDSRPHGDSAQAVECLLGLDRGELLDLSASMNPVAPDYSYLLLDHLHALRRYPDTSRARNALGDVMEVDADRIIICNGAAEAIALVSKLVTRGFVKDPDFSLYRRHILDYDPDGPWWASNPNNPTGALLGPTERPHVVDEAFYHIATGTWSRRDFDQGSFVVGSLTKLFALPGLRMGYLICPDLASANILDGLQVRWEVNSLAAEALPELLAGMDLRETYDEVARLRHTFVSLLQENGYATVDSDSNYVLAANSPDLFEKLLKSKILARDTASFGIPGGVRIAVPNEKGLDRVSEALTQGATRTVRKRSPRGTLMVVGTASDSGKSIVATALCRILSDRGVSVAPFKAQNMSLNSAVTPSGHEIGRAQERQARAARAIPEVAMNPILLKPTSEMTSQVVILGEPAFECSAKEYQRRKRDLLEVVINSHRDLSRRFDVVIAEGAGSAAEINLLDHDLVNLGLAHRVGAKALLVGDIDKGGVFAALYGTTKILPGHLSELIIGYLINKIRGDVTLLDRGIARLEELTSRRVFGALPVFEDLQFDSEDSLALPGYGSTRHYAPEAIDVAVIALPRISNFTDFDPLVAERDCLVRMVSHVGQLGDPDLIILPGSKSTVADLSWLRSRHFDTAVRRCNDRGSVVLGVCGGYQMMGQEILDEFESMRGSVQGLQMLNVVTRFQPEKVTLQRHGQSAFFTGVETMGYQIHQGIVTRLEGLPLFHLDPPVRDFPGVIVEEGTAGADGTIFGSTLHGLFESDEFREAFLSRVAAMRGKHFACSVKFHDLRDQQIDNLARLISANLEVEALLASTLPHMS